MAGSTSFGAGGNDVYLMKTDPNGDSQWEKTFGGSHYDDGCSVQQTSDGGYVIAGILDVLPDMAWYDGYLIRLCPEGTLSGDLNCDGTVNFKDVEIFVSQWLQPRSISYHTDIYGVGDGITDFLDYSVIGEQWMRDE
jgi:hypothetical protein